MPRSSQCAQQRRVLPISALYLAPRVFGGNDAWGAADNGSAAVTPSEQIVAASTALKRSGKGGDESEECDDNKKFTDESDDNVGDSDDEASVASTFSCLSRNTSTSSLSDSIAQAAGDKQCATDDCDTEVRLPDDLYPKEARIAFSDQDSTQRATGATSGFHQLQPPQARLVLRESCMQRIYVQQAMFVEHQRRMQWLQQQHMQQQHFQSEIPTLLVPFHNVPASQQMVVHGTVKSTENQGKPQELDS
ncbi:unnamed protein product [Closterium sp. Naga37s-1]|nr:unnamed protein product [Closterium sp. Naga37s-1]CAI5491815.1 unnamed protein product [Closterium sp. Naga37s-1]